jgi:hypothetical protein
MSLSFNQTKNKNTDCSCQSGHEFYVTSWKEGLMKCIPLRD